MTTATATATGQGDFWSRHETLGKIANYDVRPDLIRLYRRYQRIIWAAIAALIVLIIVGLLTGWLQDAYRWFWQNTTGWTGRARPWTEVMRENPFVYAAILIATIPLPLVLFPRAIWNWPLAVFSCFWIGFLGGHTFW